MRCCCWSVRLNRVCGPPPTSVGRADRSQHEVAQFRSFVDRSPLSSSALLDLRCRPYNLARVRIPASHVGDHRWVPCGLHVGLLFYGLSARREGRDLGASFVHPRFRQVRRERGGRELSGNGGERRKRRREGTLAAGMSLSPPVGSACDLCSAALSCGVASSCGAFAAISCCSVV